MEFIVVELESGFGICQKSVAHDLSPTLAVLPPKEIILLLRYKICTPKPVFTQCLQNGKLLAVS